MAYNNIFSASDETKGAILAQHAMEQIKNAPSFNDMLSFADNPPAGATQPRPAYIATQRTNWHPKRQMLPLKEKVCPEEMGASPLPPQVEVLIGWPPSR